MAGYKHISKRVTAVVLSACLAAGCVGTAMGDSTVQRGVEKGRGREQSGICK